MAQQRSFGPTKGRVTFAVIDKISAIEKLGQTNLGLNFLHPSSIQDIEYTYPLKLMVPSHASSSNCQWLYIITFGGGLVQGDDVTVEIRVDEFAAVLVTTQSATKVFECHDGLRCKQALTLFVAPSAFIAVLPEPVMCFSEAVFTQRQEIHMDPSSNMILLDWLYAGRVARGEAWDFTSYESRTQVHINEVTLFRDATVVQDTPLLSMKKAMDKYQVIGNVLLIGNDLSELSKNLCGRFNRPKKISDVYDNNKFICASPLEYKIDGMFVRGCVIRFAMQSTEEAYVFLDSILCPMYTILGGNPFITT